MTIKKKHLDEIEALVARHCRENGMVPRGHRIVVSVSLESDFQVIVKSGATISLLKQDPRVLWQRDNAKLHFYGVKVANFLENSHRSIPTMYALATKRQGDILKYRDCGKKCLYRMEEWLETFGLHFGMIFPDEIVAEFQKKSSGQDTNATDGEPVGLMGLGSLIQGAIDNEAPLGLAELIRQAQDEEGTPIPLNDSRFGGSEGSQIPV